MRRLACFASLTLGIVVTALLTQGMGCFPFNSDCEDTLSCPMGGHGGNAGTGGGSGGCASCPDDGNPCTETVCDAGCSTTNLPMGTDCGGGNVCNAQAQCVACLDDAAACAGSCSNLCNGQVCSVAAECKTGQCVDGVCCDAACDGVCMSCAVPGRQGTCVSVPAGALDEGTCLAPADCGAVGTQICVCDGMMTPACMVALGGKLGDPCTMPGQCFNNTCERGVCRLQVGDNCDDDVACGTNLCLNNLCTACDAMNACDGTMCDANGHCQVPLGEPCGMTADCAQGTCTSDKLCKLAAGTCTADVQCVANCENGICSVCTENAQCDSMICDAGSCRFPTGAYCFVSTNCASGVCEKFPAKCQ